MDNVTGWVKDSFEFLFGAEADPGALLLRWLAAALLLFAGWLIAALLKRMTLHLLQGAGRVGRRVSGIRASADPRFAQAATHVVGSIVFWGILLVFVALSGRLLNLAIVDRGIEALIAYLPSLAAGIVVILAGTILGGLAYPLVGRSAQSAGLEQAALLGRITQVAIIVAAGVIGATELGLDVSFLTNIALVVLGGIVGAFGLGLALGTPSHVNNIIGARNVRRWLSPGDRVRIDKHQGTVVEIGPTHVLLDAENGQVVIPARHFAEKTCTKLSEDDHGGS